MEPVRVVKEIAKHGEVNNENGKAFLDNSGTSDDIDGRKGRKKSKKHRKTRGKKQQSQNVLENGKGTRVRTADEGTGGKERLSAARKTVISSAKDVRPHQPGFRSPCKREERGSSRTPKRPNQQTQSPNSQTSAKQTPSGSPKSRHSAKKKNHKKKKTYEEYWAREQVSASLKRNEIYQGVLRINAKNYEMAWVSIPCFKRDIAILGLLNRNRALNGDVVAIEILPREKWTVMEEEIRYHEEPEGICEKLLALKMTSDENGEPNSEKNDNACKSPRKRGHIKVEEVPEKYLQKTAKVVYILEKKHPRVACGYLRPMTNQDDPDGLFSPTDSRLPRLRIPQDLCPSGFRERPQDFQTTLLIARLTEWPREAPHDSYFGLGCFARSLGEAGEIEPETDGILMVNGIDWSPFSPEVLACLPKESPWKIPQYEIDTRRDFRETCVFTIDPATARDLDDALHCNPRDDGTFEVGVHIADVSYFVKEGTDLDRVASDRATSTYMVQKVVPMLPRLLCEELCSLNPGEDRLTFSVVWKMNKDGTIQDEWMGKGVIRSRVKLSYEHAQEMINDPEKVWSAGEHPPLESGTIISDIAKRVGDLHRIAVNLRRKRFENGTLRLDKAKISFNLDDETGLPVGWHPYIQKESNKLIEEFMLLANMAVAHRIYNAFPETALLRCHPKPDTRQLSEIQALCKSVQIKFSPESSKGIQESLNTFASDSPEHLVLSQLAMKPMKPAKYFCSASAEGDPEQFVHYALSVPLYTHFTSPIRRYPDVIVHRLLAACLKVGRVPCFTSDDLEVIASHCNDKKYAAKCAGEASVELYLGAFIRECGPLMEDGIVVNVMHEAIDILVPSFGIIKRVYFKFCDQIKSFDFEEGHKTRAAKARVTWKNPENKQSSTKEKRQRTDCLTIFSRVCILLMTERDKKKNKGGLRFVGELMPNSEKKES